MHINERNTLSMKISLRAFLISLLLLFSISFSAIGETDFYTEMPLHLRFTQETQKEVLTEDTYVQRTYPHTAHDGVTEEMRLLIDEMTERGRALLPIKKGVSSALDVGAVISRTGTSVLSFLTLAEVSSDKERLSIDYQARVYDLETGKQLTMSDFFADDSDAWSILAAAVNTQLSAAFPSFPADSSILQQLCKVESLKEAAFTLGAARLTLTYRADLLYPGKNTLLHVHVYYPELREHMTEYGRQQTDNSRFKMLALTYDDGPARGTTRRVLDTLRAHGAQATFFIVGKNIAKNHDILARQQDSKHSIQSHSYTHTYPRDLKPDGAFKEDEQIRREMGETIGVLPTMMRAPGGTDPYYIKREIGYPLINWSAPSGDSGNDNVKGITDALKKRAADGAIVLMHDINSKCHMYTDAFLAYLNQRGFLCVTLEELFADAGVPLEPNVSYLSPYRIAE